MANTRIAVYSTWLTRNCSVMLHTADEWHPGGSGSTLFVPYELPCMLSKSMHRCCCHASSAVVTVVGLSV